MSQASLKLRNSLLKTLSYTHQEITCYRKIKDIILNLIKIVTKREKNSLKIGQKIGNRQFVKEDIQIAK